MGIPTFPTLTSSELFLWSRVGSAIVTTLSYSLLVVFGTPSGARTHNLYRERVAT